MTITYANSSRLTVMLTFYFQYLIDRTREYINELRSKTTANSNQDKAFINTKKDTKKLSSNG
jgi:hypothetical protein